METAIILPGFLNRLDSYYTLRDHREEACLSQTSVKCSEHFIVLYRVEATTQSIWTPVS